MLDEGEELSSAGCWAHRIDNYSQREEDVKVFQFFSSVRLLGFKRILIERNPYLWTVKILGQKSY